MIPTPDLSHLTAKDYDTVYEPAEDTFLLLDALEHDAEEMKELRPNICLEIGSGSGCVSAFLGGIIGSSHSLFLCTDINRHSSLCTFRTGTQNKVPLDPIVASFAAPLLKRLRHQVDILIFNPPYVPTLEMEASLAQNDPGVAAAWAGGLDGMQVTNEFLGHVEHLLSPRGRFYLVAVAPNNIAEISKRMKDLYGLESDIVLQRRAGREHLFIVRFRKSPS